MEGPKPDARTVGDELRDDQRPVEVHAALGSEPPSPPARDAARDPTLAIFEPEGAAQLPLDERLAAAAALGQRGDPRLKAPLARRMLPVPRIEGLLVARYPVTVEEYRELVQDGGYSRPELWDARGWELRRERGWTSPRDWESQQEVPNAAVASVSWYEARAYCAWLSARTGTPYRLPWGGEWRAAAHPLAGGAYPWGEPEPDSQRANFFATRLRRPSPVGLFPAGAGPYGHLDLAGNVYEWCLEEGRGSSDEDIPWSEAPRQEGDSGCHPDGDARRVIRGGAWGSGARGLRCAHRQWVTPKGRVSFVGFRVVCRVPPDDG